MKNMTEAKPKKERAPRPPRNAAAGDNTVYIGKKPVMNYVVACLTFFNSGSAKVSIKARGRSICRAVDTVELLRRAFLKDVQLEGINMSTEEVEREGGRKSNVSAIEIMLSKP
jgi:DNA-binding protein